MQDVRVVIKLLLSMFTMRQHRTIRDFAVPFLFLFAAMLLLVGLLGGNRSLRGIPGRKRPLFVVTSGDTGLSQFIQFNVRQLQTEGFIR
jgi:hypothetical protein